MIYLYINYLMNIGPVTACEHLLRRCSFIFNLEELLILLFIYVAARNNVLALTAEELFCWLFLKLTEHEIMSLNKIFFWWPNF